MKIKPGMLVKTLSGSIVKAEKQTEPNYWSCDDGRTYLAAALREANEVERKHYALISNRDQETKNS